MKPRASGDGIGTVESVFSTTITHANSAVDVAIAADAVEARVRTLLGLDHERRTGEAGVDELLIHAASIVDVSLGLVARLGAHVIDLRSAVRTIHSNALALGASTVALGAVATLVEPVRGGDHVAVGRALASIDGRFEIRELTEAAAALIVSGVSALAELIDVPHGDVYAELLAAVPAPHVGAGTASPIWSEPSCAEAGGSRPESRRPPGHLPRSGAVRSGRLTLGRTDRPDQV